MTTQRLTANVREVDRTRVSRLLLAWLDGDRLASDVVLAEAMAEPTGTPGLLFALTGFAAELAERCVPDVREQLRASLLAGLGTDPGEGP